MDSLTSYDTTTYVTTYRSNQEKLGCWLISSRHGTAVAPDRHVITCHLVVSLNWSVLLSALFWFLMLGCWLLAGIVWCVRFAALGLKFEVEPEMTASDADLNESVHNDLASAA